MRAIHLKTLEIPGLKSYRTEAPVRHFGKFNGYSLQGYLFQKCKRSRLNKSTLANYLYSEVVHLTISLIKIRLECQKPC